MQQLQYLNAEPFNRPKDLDPTVSWILPSAPGYWETFRGYSFTSQMVYGLLDSFYTTGSGLRNGAHSARHMDGTGAYFSEVEGAYINSVLAISPLTWGAGGISTSSSAARTEANGSFYSVAYEMKLSSNLYPNIYRGAHFKAANEALDIVISADARFASSMSELGITIPRSPAGSILGKSPANWVWHHDIGVGVMQLVPKYQHTVNSIFWETLHPYGVGGYSIWGK